MMLWSFLLLPHYPRNCHGWYQSVLIGLFACLFFALKSRSTISTSYRKTYFYSFSALCSNICRSGSTQRRIHKSFADLWNSVVSSAYPGLDSMRDHHSDHPEVCRALPLLWLTVLFQFFVPVLLWMFELGTCRRDSYLSWFCTCWNFFDISTISFISYRIVFPQRSTWVC